MSTLAVEAFSTVAVTSLICFAIVDLHLEFVAGAVAWTAAWWLLREQPAGDEQAADL